MINITKIYLTVKDIIVKERRLLVIFIHIIQAALANYFAFIIRFEAVIPPSDFNLFISYLPVLLTIRLILYLQAGLYKDLWRYASISDLIKIIKSATIGSIIFFLMIRYLIGEIAYPRSIYVLDFLLFIIISGGSRFFVRVFREYISSKTSGRKVFIIGTGSAGEMIVRDMKNDPKLGYKPIGFIDNDPHKKGLAIHGVPILGPCSMISKFIENHKPEEIIISLPSTSSSTLKEIYELCKPFNVTIKKLPGLNDILNGNISVESKLGKMLIDANVVTESQVQEALTLQKEEGGRLGSKLVELGYISEKTLFSSLQKQYSVSHIKPISLEDLLQREPVRTDIKSVRDYIEDKSVMVTGAGGSIGSELCSQIINYSPSKIILLDRYENTLMHVDIELRKRKQKPDIVTTIGDIQDALTLEYLFLKHKPQIIFHAAAYKHVPLMEYNPIEAIKNNIFGTKKILEAASRHNAASFVMISTDKAVNPTSIMGATKRVAELLTMSMSSTNTTKFTTVRFGNVLGSNGSVVPIFEKQIKHGGPVTVTHPEIKRFFMLIPEAIQLVLIASAAGKGGEIFVLDMGEQIKIIDLAENLIRLTGFIPYEDIKIKFTGLRPGEKLYEELFDESETVVPTFHGKLRIAIPEIPSVDNINKHILELEQVVLSNAFDKVVPVIQRIVPNFKNYKIDNAEIVKS
ncbi:MAG: polysaccharide biosynthesis protein [Nitrospirota bacterium]|nr:polysaccharide biosynthesis protein [Nitrospirota bacterium]MDH5769272.1 polysaccharide biosynthesis protein [Nitrospirota bacterium]